MLEPQPSLDSTDATPSEVPNEHHTGDGDASNSSANAGAVQFPPRKSSLASTTQAQQPKSSILEGFGEPSADDFAHAAAMSESPVEEELDTSSLPLLETKQESRDAQELELEDIPEIESATDKPIVGEFTTTVPLEAVQDAVLVGDQEAAEDKLDFEFGDLSLKAYDTTIRDDKSDIRSSTVETSSVSVQTDLPTIMSTSPPGSQARPTSKSRGQHSIFASRIRRRSWMSTSRSPSPKKSEQRQSVASSNEEAEVDEPITMSSTRKEPPATTTTNSRPSSSQRNSSFSKQFASRLRKRPSQGPALETVVDESLATKSNESSFFGRMQKSASEDKLSIPALVPSTRSSDRLSSFAQPDGLSFALNTKTRQARKRDELWSAFRDLDGACQRFNSKHLDQKGSVLRTSLLPFLQEHESHPSNLRLHPEDLDRRSGTLHRWWLSLLEFIKSRIFPMAANGTKAMALDAILGIMERPEWRQSPSPFCPVLAKKHSDAISESNSANSEHEFLVESVQHNVRNYFSHCLLSQMAFVVEKMSSRAAPSLVAFCGKTCAYAFFFCPGVASLMIHLWRPPMDVMKRVLEENSMSASADYSGIVETLASTLPPTMKDTQFSSLANAIKIVRAPAPIPVGTENLAWKGPWADRWSGQDSDLFYAFVRQYFILLYDYLPEASKEEKVLSAGGLFVQAQILVNMNATIKRHVPKPFEPPPILPSTITNKFAGLGAKDSQTPDEQRKPASITFDDVLADPESSASPVPFAPTNADRIMAENRLIMLLRDILVTYANEVPSAVQETFAQTFADLMRAVAKTTPQYNRFASDALCDFIEEAVVIFVRYEQTNSLHASFMDWSFWFQVWKKMASSNNYFTEMKVYSTLYTIWPTIALQAERKAELCTNFLLDRDHFESRFSHWSPMVRSYFMRLLAWRVARCSEDVSDDDLKLIELLADRLLSVYGNYLYLREQGKAPNTSPSNPAPGRRFIIVRADHTQSTRSGPLITFDAPSTPHNAAYKRSLMLEQLCSPDINPEDRPMSAMSFASSNASDSDRDIDDSPKRWTGGLLRTIIGTSKGKAQSPHRPPGVRAASAPALRPSSKQSSIQERIDLVTKPSSQAFSAYRTYCFRFSLELVDRRMGAPASMQLQLPRLPQPAQLLLTRHLRGIALNAETSDDEEAVVPVSADDASAGTVDSTTTPAENASSVGSDEQAPANINPQASWATKLIQPTGQAKVAAPYCGRALAEWTILISESHMFFERRKAEGVPGNRWVETPLLGTEVLRRPL